MYAVAHKFLWTLFDDRLNARIVNKQQKEITMSQNYKAGETAKLNTTQQPTEVRIVEVGEKTAVVRIAHTGQTVEVPINSLDN